MHMTVSTESLRKDYPDAQGECSQHQDSYADQNDPPHMGPSQLISGICIVQNQAPDDGDTSSLEDITEPDKVSPKNRKFSK